MSLVTCSECGKDISDQAKACPNCGGINTKYRAPGKSGTSWWVWGIGIVIVFSLWNVISTPSKKIDYSKGTADYLVIEAGMLKNDFNKIGKRFNVKMTNGMVEKRDNDIEELAKDWAFYKERILKASQEGDIPAMDKARASFQDVNAWLDKYNQEDVAFALSRWGKR